MTSPDLDGPAIAGFVVAGICTVGLIVSEVRLRLAKSEPCPECKDDTAVGRFKCAHYYHVPRNIKPTHSKHRLPIDPVHM